MNMNNRQAKAVRAELARDLKERGLSLEAIAKVLKLKSKEWARMLVARGERMARSGPVALERLAGVGPMQRAVRRRD